MSEESAPVRTIEQVEQELAIARAEIARREERERDEINEWSLREDCERIAQSIFDVYAIAARFSGQEWNADMCDDVARILRGAGIPIADLEEGEEDAT